MANHPPSIKLSIIVAMAENRAIGKDNTLLWHIPEDLKFFKAKTLDHALIMGRKTYQSITDMLGKPLPKRYCVVLSRDESYSVPSENGCVTSSLEKSIEIAKEFAAQNNQSEVFCAGGGTIYERLLPYTDRIYLTNIQKTFKGDTFFPKLDTDYWKETACQKGKKQDEVGLSYQFLTFDRL